VDVAKTLARQPLFAGVEPQVRSALAQHAQLIHRKRRETVVRQGAPADAVYVILRGRLKITVRSSEGAATSLSVLGPGEIFGELGVLGAASRSADVLALEDATVLRIPGPVFLDAMSSSAALGLALSRLLAHRLRATGEVFGQTNALQAKARFAQRLLVLLEHFGEDSATGKVLDVPLTQMDLAELATLSRQRTNQLLQELKRRGVLDRDGRRLLIRNVDALRGLASESPA
jgi:CRP-like cAMP-binding protein